MEALLPMKLHNSIAGVDTDLLYPPEIDVVAPLPTTKRRLLQLSGEF